MKIKNMSEVIYSVEEITSLISNFMEQQIGQVMVSGEVSNLKIHSSGHIYFTLKEELASISAVIWRTRSPKFQLKEGMKLLAAGKVSVFKARGTYQLDCIWVQARGVGDLYLAFEELKAKLEIEGYFDKARKRELPQFIRKVGIATSQTGSVLQDILTTLRQRAPYIEILLRPTIVQGAECSKDVAKAISELNETDCDVIVVGRGGGSIEDLWGFNSEIVANAIYKSKKPIISAVGHETDFTIADFVADLRAATPTMAATYCSLTSIDQISVYLENKSEAMKNSIETKIRRQREYLEFVVNERFENKIQSTIELYRNKLKLATNIVQGSIRDRIKNVNHSLEKFDLIIKNANLEVPLKKGYALLRNNGKVITSKDLINSDMEIELETYSQIIKTKVTETTKKGKK